MDFLLSVGILAESLHQIPAVCSVDACQLLQRLSRENNGWGSETKHATKPRLDGKVCVYLAAAFTLSSHLPRLRLLELHVLLLSPFKQKRRGNVRAVVSLSESIRPSHACICDSLVRVFSASSSLRRCSTSSRRSFELKLKTASESVSQRC